MTTWFISRHPGALHWMQTNNIHFDHHLTHWEKEPIAAGDTVIGSLPVHLAAEICTLGAHYWNLSLELPEQARGQELSAEELDLFQARLEAFNIATNKTAPNPALEKPKQASSPAPEPAKAEVAPTPEPKETRTTNSYQPDKEELSLWNFEVFKAFIFNQENPAKGEETAARLIEDVGRKVAGNPEIMAELDKTLRQGRHALGLTEVLENKLKNGTPLPLIQEWVNSQKQSQSVRIGRHLQIKLDKTAKFYENKQKQSRSNSDFKVTLPATQLVDGLHPQSLRAMQPAQEWDIYIDETGTQFDTQAAELNETDTKLGRIIALALPAGHKLEKLAKPVHAVDLPLKEIENLLKTITQSKTGILGATLKKDLLSSNWMSAVHQLCRWALLMLPMQDKPSRVRLHIEARSPYDKDEQLLALQDTLASELRTLLPERFNQLHLSLHIMGKDNPYNGYVDVIANCWGSSNATKHKMLARTAWRGQCLLQTDQLTRIEDIYRSISSGEVVKGYHWFELCAASLEEPEYSLLHDMLNQLGERSRKDASIWLDYLQETRRRMDSKDFTPASLQAALHWLEEWQQADQVLPAYLQLELYSMQLATSNHQGATHLQLVQKLLPLIEQLTDESPDAACQAVLRIAVRSTHLYEFKGTLPLLEEWLAYPIAVPGLINHAKLQSTLGQLHAFQGQHSAALKHFYLALQTLERLSDPEQKRRDSQQTQLYRALVLQAMQDPKAADEALQLVHQATKRTGKQALGYLARSGSSLRFVHYLLVRLLVNQPNLEEERQTYLAEANSWQQEEGHPWMLINAYRAWLLTENQQTKTATELMQNALDNCLNSGQPMLEWMGHCLTALASSLGLKLDLEDELPLLAAHYPAAELPQLATATDNPSRLKALQVLLPFNFH